MQRCARVALKHTAHLIPGVDRDARLNDSAAEDCIMKREAFPRRLLAILDTMRQHVQLTQAPF